MEELTKKIKEFAVKEGADLVGVASAEQFEEDRTKPRDLLPDAQSVVVLALRLLDGGCRLTEAGNPHHPRMYVTSNQMAYPEINRIGFNTARFIERHGFDAVMVRAYYGAPMDKETRGWIGDFNMTKAGEEAGLGEIGENNNLLTREYGPRVILVPIITTAKLIPDGKFQGKICDECNLCIEICPPKALKGKGQLDYMKCLQFNEPESLPGLINFLSTKIVGKNPEEQSTALRSPKFWNLWYFLLYGGLSYSCGRCIRICPKGNSPNTKTLKPLS